MLIGDIPDELNTLNIKLFPIYPAPPPVKAWHVPLFTVRYQTFMDENWDLTMQRVRSHLRLSLHPSQLNFTSRSSHTSMASIVYG